MNDKNKKRTIALGVTVLVVLAGYTFTDRFSAKPEPLQFPARIGEKPLEKENARPATVIQKETLLELNPFIELSTLEKIPDSSLPSPANADLPALPQQRGVLPPPPAPVGNIPIPSLPASSASGASASAPQNKAAISGVIAGPNGTIAIMADGKVVGVGDSYAGNSIAYIGGDGIQFDNGDKIEYK